jgi:thioredoxin 1
VLRNNNESKKVKDKTMRNNRKIALLTDENFQAEILDYEGWVLVVFGAQWCGPCHMVAPILKDLVSEFEGTFKIGQMDIDQNPQVTSKHGIQSTPTFLFFYNGQILDHVVGAVSKETLVTKLTTLLQNQKKENKK